MEAKSFVPAAQYVRMSTDRQQYSIENQMHANAEYARRNGFEIIKTFSDPGRSGLGLKHRPGLRSLLAEVMQGRAPYKAILVYDVSRWGRFQDTDEAAHYEFLCKVAGVPLVYCAEQFPGDLSAPAALLKVLKRTMAAEFSRVQGGKISVGQRRIAKLGFKMGGVAGFGFRRLLVTKDGVRRRFLGRLEWKNVGDDRVLLSPGKPADVRVVQQIYASFLRGKKITQIVQDLNARKVRYCSRPWDYGKVRRVLTNPKYKGECWWGKTAGQLGGPKHSVPESDWIQLRAPALVSGETFERVRKRVERTCYRARAEDAIEELKLLYRREGKLSYQRLRRCGIPGTAGLLTRGLPAIYGALGIEYDKAKLEQQARSSRAAVMRRSVIDQIHSLLEPTCGRSRRPGGRTDRLELRDGAEIAVEICRALTKRGRRTWVRQGRSCDNRDSYLVLISADEAVTKVVDLHCVPTGFVMPKQFRKDYLAQPPIVHIRSLSELPGLIAKLSGGSR